jgi:hypothetical protein
LTLGVSLLSSIPATAATILDQSFAPSPCCSYYNFGSSQSDQAWVGQTFTAGVTGQLSQVNLAIYKTPAFDTGLSVDIFVYNPGDNTLGASLGSVSLANSQVPSFGGPGSPTNIYGVSLDLSGLNIGVSSGSTYAILAAVNGPTNYPGTNIGISWIGSDFEGADEYTGGHFTQATGALSAGSTVTGGFGNADLAFQTYVTPVPVPPTSWLMLSGLAGLGAMVRKRRTA